MTEFEKLTRKIKKYQDELNQMIQLRKAICTHKNIESESWVDDDYAQSYAQRLTQSYKCKDCGLYVSYEYPSSSDKFYKTTKEEPSEIFKLLDKIYHDKNRK